MKHGLMRPTAALFPAVLLAAALLGSRDRSAVLMAYCCLIQLCSLCSAESFRNAAAREPGVRRVDRRFSGAWLPMCFGIALAMAVRREVSPWIIAAAGCISIEHLFEERMFALSRRLDGAILSLIANLLLLAGLMLDGGNREIYTACGAALGMVISIVTAYALEDMHGFSLIPRSIGFFPKAAAQSLLLPAIAYLLRGFGPDVLAAMILWRLSRSVCRRSHDESRALNLLLTAACAALAMASIGLPMLIGYANSALAAMICAMIVFCAPSWRLYAGGALLIAANVLLILQPLPAIWNGAMVCIASAAAVVLNLHKAFLRKR